MERSTALPVTATGVGVQSLHGQARRVADSLTHESCHEVYRRRVLYGPDATRVRDAVRAAVTDSLKNSTRTHEQAADAGATEAIRALWRVGVETEQVDFEHAGWKDRLTRVGDNIDAGDIVAAVTELRAMIAGIA